MTRRTWKGTGRYYTAAWADVERRFGVPTACYWCGGEAGNPAHGGAGTLDHLDAVAAGGAEWSLENLVPACRPCNSSRGARPGPPRRVAALAEGGTSRPW